MQDVFATAPRELRTARLREYEQYLIERDGELNIEQRTLSRREERIRRYEAPPRRVRELDPAIFGKHYADFKHEPSMSEELLLLLALVKVNSAEAYGVSQNFQRTMARALKSGDESELRILCEEGYHTRILLSSSNHYGLEVKSSYRPPSALRIMIGGIATAPMAIARPLTLAGEIIATLMFIKLFRTTERVLKHDPETRNAFLERIMETCVDERGHITYNRMHMSALDLAHTRTILPLTARIMSNVFREMVALGAYPLHIWEDLPLLYDDRHLPEEVRRSSFVA